MNFYFMFGGFGGGNDIFMGGKIKNYDDENDEDDMPGMQWGFMSLNLDMGNKEGTINQL